jgi:hypothetical protein
LNLKAEIDGDEDGQLTLLDEIEVGGWWRCVMDWHGPECRANLGQKKKKKYEPTWVVFRSVDPIQYT